MTHDDASRLLDDIAVLRHPCDLDLLVFFARHRRCLLTSEQIAVWLGYDITQIAESLQQLLGAGFITRTQNQTHAARMYVFVVGGTPGGWLPALLALASTREGRLALLDALARRAPHDRSGPDASAHDSTGAQRPRPTLVRQTPQGTTDTQVR